MAQVGRSQSQEAQQSFVVLAHQVLPGVEVIPKAPPEHQPDGSSQREITPLRLCRIFREIAALTDVVCNGILKGSIPVSSATGSGCVYPLVPLIPYFLIFCKVVRAMQAFSGGGNVSIVPLQGSTMVDFSRSVSLTGRASISRSSAVIFSPVNLHRSQ